MPLSHPQASETIEVNGPTIVAFFVPAAEIGAGQNTDGNEALADFQFYAGQVREPLRKSGVQFRVLYAGSFAIRTGHEVFRFNVRKDGVGYFFFTPGKKPKKLLGVMNDSDLLQLASQHFGTPVP